MEVVSPCGAGWRSVALGLPVESKIPREPGLLGWWEVAPEWLEDSSGSCECVSVRGATRRV